MSSSWESSDSLSASLSSTLVSGIEIVLLGICRVVDWIGTRVEMLWITNLFSEVLVIGTFCL